ncbi:MAG: hypothetical protein ACRCVW_04950 [Brevinema sp.]
MEKTKANEYKFDRFGMNILPLSIGSAIYSSGFPTSFYLANKKNYIISFGIDYNKSLVKYGVTIEDSQTQQVVISFLTSWEIGGHIGFGQLFPLKKNKKIHLGYLIELSAGYVHNSEYNTPFYIGFQPKFILEYDTFLFTFGVYIDTSLFISSVAGFGFLLK